jgi:hypothetical protein
MHTHNFFFVGPTRHEALYVALSQSVVKRSLNIVRVATQCGGLKFGFAHGVLRNKKTRRAPGFRKLVSVLQRPHFIF